MHFPGLSAKLPRRHPMRLEHQYTASSTKRALFVPELVKFIVSSTKQVDFVLEVQKEDS